LVLGRSGLEAFSDGFDGFQEDLDGIFTNLDFAVRAASLRLECRRDEDWVSRARKAESIGIRWSGMMVIQDQQIMGSDPIISGNQKKAATRATSQGR
jgi:hypothetical protein